MKILDDIRVIIQACNLLSAPWLPGSSSSLDCTSDKSYAIHSHAIGYINYNLFHSFAVFNMKLDQAHLIVKMYGESTNQGELLCKK